MEINLESVLKELISKSQEEVFKTQEDLRERLVRKGFDVNQSSISRALKRIGAVKVALANGGFTYTLPEDPTPTLEASIGKIVVGVENNEYMLVVRTVPGAASLVARYLDYHYKKMILGTIAGDDTIFVALRDSKKVKSFQKDLMNTFSAG